MKKPQQFLKNLETALVEIGKLLEADYKLAPSKDDALADLIPFDENKKRYSLDKFINQRNSSLKINQKTIKPSPINDDGLLQVVIAYNMLQAIHEHYQNYLNSGLTSIYSTVMGGKNDIELQRGFNLLYHSWTLNTTKQQSADSAEQANERQVSTAAVQVYDEPSKKAALIIAKIMDELKNEENFAKDYLGKFASTVLSLMGGFTNDDFQNFTAASAAACRYQIELFECGKNIKALNQRQEQKIAKITLKFKVNFKCSINQFSKNGATEFDAYTDLMTKVTVSVATLQQDIVNSIIKYQDATKKEIDKFNEQYFPFVGKKITQVDRDYINLYLTPVKKDIYNDVLNLLNIFKSKCFNSEELTSLINETAAIELIADIPSQTIEQLMARWSNISNEINFDLNQFESNEQQFKLLNKQLLAARGLEFIYSADIIDLTLPNSPLVIGSIYQNILITTLQDIQPSIQRIKFAYEFQAIKQQVKHLQQEAHGMSCKQILTAVNTKIELLSAIQQNIAQADCLQTTEKEKLQKVSTEWNNTLVELKNAAHKSKAGLYEQANEIYLVYQQTQKELDQLKTNGQQYIANHVENFATELQAQSNTLHFELASLKHEVEDLNLKLHTSQKELDSLNRTLVKNKSQIDTLHQFRAATKNGIFNQKEKAYDALSPDHYEVIKNLANAKNLKSVVQQELEVTSKELEQVKYQLKALKNLQSSVKNALGTDDLSSLKANALQQAGFSKAELAVWQPVIKRASAAKGSAYSSILNGFANSVTRMKDGRGNATQLLDIINKKLIVMQNDMDKKNQQINLMKGLNQLKEKHVKEAEQAIKFKKGALDSAVQNTREKMSSVEENIAKTNKRITQVEQQINVYEQMLSVNNNKLVSATLLRKRKNESKQLQQLLEIILQQINKDYEKILHNSEELFFDKKTLKALKSLEADLNKTKFFMSDTFYLQGKNYKNLWLIFDKLTEKYEKYKALSEKLKVIEETLHGNVKQLAINEINNKAHYDEVIENYTKKHQQLQQCQKEFMQFIANNDITGQIKNGAEEVQKLLMTKLTQESEQFEAIRSKQKELRIASNLKYLAEDPKILNGLITRVSEHFDNHIAEQKSSAEHGIGYRVRSLSLFVTQLLGLNKFNKWIAHTYITTSEKILQKIAEQKQEFINEANVIQNGLKIVVHMNPQQAKLYTSKLYSDTTHLIEKGNKLVGKPIFDLAITADRLKVPVTPVYPSGTEVPNWLSTQKSMVVNDQRNTENPSFTPGIVGMSTDTNAPRPNL